MKRLVLASLSILLASFTIVPTAQARNHELTPFQLVNLARNGYLMDHGIPRFNQLSFAHRNNRISAEDVIQAAIDDDRVSAEVLEDQGYVFAVDNFLHDLHSPSNNN